MKTCLIVQARMGSERLPGKVLRTVQRKSLLEYELERLAKVLSVDELLMATTTNPFDQAIEDLCKRLSILCYRGSEEDVLARFYEAAKWQGADAVVRVCADCPLIDPAVVDRVISFYLHHPGMYDYVSNTLTRTYPRGMDCEIFSFKALSEAFQEAVEKRDREHVTPFFYTHPERYRLANVSHPQDLSVYRLTVDEEADFQLVQKILMSLYDRNPYFGLQDIVKLLEENPNWLRMNQNVRQKILFGGKP